MKIEYSKDERLKDLILIRDSLLKVFNGDVQKAEKMFKDAEKANRMFGENGLAKELGKDSIEFFCKYYLQDIFVPSDENAARELAPFHLEMWRRSEELLIQDKYDKLAMTIFRGGAKTTIEDLAVSIWAHCYQKSYYTIVLGAVEMDSMQFIAGTREQFEENKRINEDFGSLINARMLTTNKLQLELTNGTMIQALSSGSSIRGKKYKNHRPTLIISDDYQNLSDVVTEQAREKKWRVWEDDVKYAGDKAVIRRIGTKNVKVKNATKFIVLGTILHPDCYMSKIMKSTEYEQFSVPLINFDPDEVFNQGLWAEFKKIYYQPGMKVEKRYQLSDEFYKLHEDEMKFDFAWPDKFTCDGIAIDYYTDPIGFKREMLNDAKNIGEKFFKSNRALPLEEINKEVFKKTALVIDPASGGEKKNDYTVYLVLSESDTGFIYARKGELAKFNAQREFETYCKHIVEYLLFYKDITHVMIEKNTFSGADVNRVTELMKEVPELKNRKITFVNENQRRNKENKISTIIGDVNNGRVIFNLEDEEFINQVMDYQGEAFTEHDDAPDALSEGIIRLRDITTVVYVNFLSKKLLF